MAQFIIDYGSSANDGQGDPLRTAFIKTDENFDQIWAAGPVGSNITILNNTVSVSNTNGNLVLQPNGVGVIQANAAVVPSLSGAYDLGTTERRWKTIFANTITANNISYQGNVFTGNLEGNVLFSDSVTLLINNVTGEITANSVSAPVTVTNIIRSDDSAFVEVQDGINVDGSAIVTNDVAVGGNVSAQYFIGNGSQLTGIASSYGNADVAAYLAAGLAGNIIPAANITYSLGNATNQWANVWVAANTIYIGGVPLGVTGNVLTVNGEPVLSNDSSSSITTTGNITASNFVGTVFSDYVQFLDSGSVTESYISETGFIVGSNNSATLATLQAQDVRIITDFNGGGITWTFGADGNLSAPGSITTTGNLAAGNILTDNYLYANGSPFVSASTGNITFSDTTMSPPDGVDITISAANSEVIIGAFDIRLDATDDLRLTGNDVVSLRNRSTTDSITIRTDYDNTDYVWEFAVDGTLNTPGDIVVNGDITGTAGGSTLVIRAEPGSNTALQLNDIVDSEIRTVANLEIRTDVANTPYVWNFDNAGGLTFPDGNTQTTAYPGFDQDLNTTDTVEFLGVTASTLAVDNITVAPSGLVNLQGANLAAVNALGAVTVTAENFVGNIAAANVVGTVASARDLVNGTTAVRIPLADGSVVFDVDGFEDIMDVNPEGLTVWGNTANVQGDLVVAGTTDITGNVTTGNLIVTESLFGSSGSPQPTISGFSTISATGNITGGNVITDTLSNSGNISVSAGNVIVKTDDARYEWVFDWDGGLTLPSGTIGAGEGGVIWSPPNRSIWISGTTANSSFDGSGVVLNGGLNQGTGRGGGISLFGGLSAGGRGGDIFIDAGLGDGSANNGRITIGTVNTSSTVIGTVAQSNNTFYGTVVGNVSGFDTANASAPQSITIRAGDNTGGDLFNAANGGTLTLRGGDSGFNPGGALQLRGGNGSVDGDVIIGDITTTSVKIGNTAIVANVVGNLSVGVNATVIGDITAGNINLPDSGNISLGASRDLVIYHNGINSYIQDTGTGRLFIDSAGGLQLRVNYPANESALTAEDNGNVVLYYNNLKRIETTTDGVEVTSNIAAGNISVTGIVSVTGNVTGGNIITTGNVSGNTAGFALGYRDIPQIAFTGNVTMAAADAGKHFYSTESTDYILTIADNSAVSWPVGTAITVVNRGTGNITVAQASGVSLYLAGNSTAANRTVSTYGMATLLNVAANVWMINGTGVS